jgi:hypothetical protein
MPKSKEVRRTWTYGVLAAILVIGCFFATMIAVRPYGSSGWMWAAALTIYVPFVLVGASVLRYLLLIARRLFRR